MKAGRLVFMSLVLVLAMAVPASAAPGLAVAKPWHYWLSIVLVASFLGLAALLALGYVVRVVAAKYGVRVGKR